MPQCVSRSPRWRRQRRGNARSMQLVQSGPPERSVEAPHADGRGVQTQARVAETTGCRPRWGSTPCCGMGISIGVGRLSVPRPAPRVIADLNGGAPGAPVDMSVTAMVSTALTLHTCAEFPWQYHGVPPPLSRLPLPMIRSLVPCIHVGTTRNWSPSVTVALNLPCPSDGGAAPSPLRRPSD
jgi:hypothetical protein